MRSIRSQPSNKYFSIDAEPSLAGKSTQWADTSDEALTSKQQGVAYHREAIRRADTPLGLKKTDIHVRRDVDVEISPHGNTNSQEVNCKGNHNF